MKSESPTRDASTRLVSYLSACILFLGICSIVVRCHVLQLRLQDAHTYANAIRAYEAGSDPYATDEVQTPFLYSPIFLKLLGPLLPIVPQTFVWFGYLGITALAFFYVPYAQAALCMEGTWIAPSLAMLILTVAPHGCGLSSLFSGNIAVLFYGLVMLALAPGVRSNKWSWFYIVLFMGAQLKPAWIAFTLVPLLAGEGQLLSAATVALLALISYPVQSRFFPALYAGFQQSASTQVVTRGDVGFGVLRMLTREGAAGPALRGTPLALLCGALACIVVLATFQLRSRRHLPEVKRLWLPFLLIAAVLVNPRLMSYDMAFAMVPVTYLFLECVPYLRRLRSRLVLYLGLLALLWRSTHIATLGLLVVAAFVFAWAHIYRTALQRDIP